MRRLVLFALIFTSLLSYSQHPISGTFSPAKEYTWLIAYQLLPSGQNYVADTAINNGKFELMLPANATVGLYRLVYAVPQDEFYFDVIYNGKEDIMLSFNSREGVVFSTSEENILFGTYFKDINGAKRRLLSFYAEGNTDVDAFKQLTQDMARIQQSYEKKSQNLLVNQFIVGNRPYIPHGYESVQDYVKNKKENYFKNLDLHNPLLQASGFLNDKLINHVFTALPLEPLSKKETEEDIQENIKAIFHKIEKTNPDFKFSVFQGIWTQADAQGYNTVSDIVYAEYVKPMADSPEKKAMIAALEIQKRLRIGAKAPEFGWKSDGTLKSLSTLEEAQNYVLIFWSSTCSHCLNELPPLHKKLKELDEVRVVAISLEDDKTTWGPESAKLEHFEHVIALGRWDSEYAKLYDIHQTPTYFILDREKHIIAKPQNDRELIEFLEKG